MEREPNHNDVVGDPKSDSCFSRFWTNALRFKPFDASTTSSFNEFSRSDFGEQRLVRRLGVFDLILIGIGASIGAGIFVVTGTVARDAGPGEFVVKVFDEMLV